MKIKELVKKLNKRDKEQIVCWLDDDGYTHEITEVKPILCYDKFKKEWISKTYVH